MSHSLIASDFEDEDLTNDKNSDLYELITTARVGNIDKVTFLLAKVDDVNGRNSKGFSALHAAVYSGNKSLIQILIDNGADVNSQSRAGITPLHIAVQENLPDVVQLLIMSGADKNLKDENGLSALSLAKREQLKSVSSILTSDEAPKKIRLPPLHSAAKRNDPMAAFSILTDKNRHPNVNETNQIGLTALHIAAQYGSIEVARLLLANGAHVGFCTKGGITPLHVASKWGKHKIVVLLISHHANINCLTNDLLTPLHCSARSGHTRVLDLLLKANGDLTLKTRSGLTPLHMAAQGDHEEVANLLLVNGAPKDDLTFDQLTPLHVSAHCGSVKVAQLLLDAKCLVDPSAMNGFTPLHIACRKNRIRVVELLVKYGANVNAFTESGLTPLHISTLLDHMGVVTLLLKNKADPNVACKTGKEETALHLACATNNVEVARELLAAGADVTIKNKVQKTPLHMACEYGNIHIVKLLLKHSPGSASSAELSLVNEPANEDYTPLHYACNAGREDLVNLLLEHGADVEATTKRGFNCFHLAAKCGNLPVLERLLSRSPNGIDVCGTNKLTPLHIATHYRHRHVVNYLVRCGAHLDARAKNGYTPLHIAAKRDNLDAAQVLIDNGAKINLLSKNGFSPLHLSALEGHHDMTSFLLKVGADPNLKGVDGLTPLHVAVQEDWLPLVELLLRTDSIDVNAQTENGFTPLHLSSHYGFLNSSKLLLNNGALTGIKNKFGNSPLHQAVQEGHIQIVEVLLDDKHIDLNSTNEQQYEPITIARKLGFSDILKLLIERGARSDARLPLSDYVKEDPESTRKKFDDSSSTSSVNLSKSREVIVQDNAIQVTESAKVRDFLDFDMFPDTSTPNPRNYDAHLTYTSSHITFNDNSEMSHSLPGATPLSMDTPLTMDTPLSMDGSLFESHLDSPFYSPAFGKVSKGEVMMKVDDEDDDDEAPVDIMKRERSNKTDRRRETWIGVLDKQTDGVSTDITNTVQYKINSEAPMGDRENGELLRGSHRGGVKIVMDRRSYDPLMSSTNYSQMPEINKVEKKEQTATAISASNLPYKGFLKSFIVDARGCVAVGGRHPGVRFIIPPNAVPGPTRITCQMVRDDKLRHPLALSDGEAVIARVIKMTSDVKEFNKPITMEIPHFGVLKSHHRELSILKSSDGKGWIEHREMKGNDFQAYSNDLEPADRLFDSSIHNISLKDLPPHMVLISRVKKDSNNIGNEGGSITSSTCPQVKAVFPEGAINKNTNVGLQVLRVDKESPSHHDVTGEHQWSPVVSIEPRCRKFHRPVTITIPLPPKTSSSSSSSPQSYRLLYSLGTRDNSSWSDITDSTSMNISNETATFETGVSARFCIVDSNHKTECLQKLPSLIHNKLQVPLLARFAVYGRRRGGRREEVKMRILCMTEPGERQTLEEMQRYKEMARGPFVELMEGDPVLVSLSDNLENLAKDESESKNSVEPLKSFITCEVTYNTRIPLLIKTETSEKPIDGHVRFACGQPYHETRNKSESDKENWNAKAQTCFRDDCILGISIPTHEERERSFAPMTSQVSRVDVQNYYHARYKNSGNDEDLKNRALKLTYISEQLGSDWPRLAHVLDLDHNEVEDIKQSFNGTQEQALVFLQKWISKRNNDPAMCADFERGVKQIGRFDILINGLYSEVDPVDNDDNFDILRYMDTETHAVDDDNDDDNGGGGGDDNDNKLVSMTTKKYLHYRKPKKLQSDDNQTANEKRIGIVAGVKRHEIDHVISDDNDDKDLYERLLQRDDDDDDDERYEKLMKFEEGEKITFGDDDDDKKIKETKLSDSDVHDFKEINNIDKNINFGYETRVKSDAVCDDVSSNEEMLSGATETTDVAEDVSLISDGFKNNYDLGDDVIDNVLITSDEINTNSRPDVVVVVEDETKFRTIPDSLSVEMKDFESSNEEMIISEQKPDKKYKKYDEGDNIIIDTKHALDINDNEDRLQALTVLDESLEEMPKDENLKYFTEDVSTCFHGAPKSVDQNGFKQQTNEEVLGFQDVPTFVEWKDGMKMEKKYVEETSFHPKLQSSDYDHHRFVPHHLSPEHCDNTEARLDREIIETKDEGTDELDRMELKDFDLEVIEEVAEDINDGDVDEVVGGDVGVVDPTCRGFKDSPSYGASKVYVDDQLLIPKNQYEEEFIEYSIPSRKIVKDDDDDDDDDDFINKQNLKVIENIPLVKDFDKFMKETIDEEFGRKVFEHQIDEQINISEGLKVSKTLYDDDDYDDDPNRFLSRDNIQPTIPSHLIGYQPSHDFDSQSFQINRSEERIVLKDEDFDFDTIDPSFKTDVSEAQDIDHHQIISPKQVDYIHREQYEDIYTQDPQDIQVDEHTDIVCDINTMASYFGAMKLQEERVESFTISSDSEGDFRDLKEEYTQKYLQKDLADIEHSTDPIDRLLYCYNASRIGNSTFYDSNNFDEDVIEPLDFMPDFFSNEPSIDQYIDISPQSIDKIATQSKSFDLKLLEKDSKTKEMTKFSEDLENYEIGSPLVIRESIDELPDGYMIGRQPHFEINVGRFDEGQDGSGNSGNVFEQIPGATGKTENDFD